MREGGIGIWFLILVWWGWFFRDVFDWVGSEILRLGFVVGGFEI